MASSSASEKQPKETILSSSSSKKKITLTSKDIDTFEAMEAVALKMQTIKNMIEDGCANNAIPLPDVEGQILLKVIEYCKRHVETEATKGIIEKRKEFELEAWDKEFIENLDMDSLYDILEASKYLDVESLLDLGCQRAADLMKGKSPEAIREMFNIEDDITKEEDEQIRNDHSWAFNSLD